MNKVQSLRESLRLDPRDLAKCLGIGISPSYLFDARPDSLVTLAEVASRLNLRLKDSSTQLADFGEEVGWALGDFLQIPDRVVDFPVACIRAVCIPLNIDVYGVIDSVVPADAE